jgi:uncharacterized protein YbaP (TraB family)
MRKFVLPLTVLFTISTLSLSAQQRGRTPVKQPSAAKPAIRDASKKYPSLLWEISGNGMKKPSYLFGTMHVSDKLAFHLGDTFYNAIKSAEVVALETNPESWQDDYSNSSFFGARGRGSDRFSARDEGQLLSDNMRITTFAIDSYEEAIKAALSVEPSMINGMLYRTYGTRTDDFEEDTFLDMYIFQVGKKLGKRLSGVENFEESEKLVVEAYKDMIRDRNRKRKSYDMEGMMTNPKKVEEAYRRGDLDLLDSLEALTVASDAFQEKFLYKRNEIQANSIDSIIKKQSLFVGVGAAHLPGKRGVIEMLRQMGYTLRPIMMDDRNSTQKEAIEKMRMEHRFVTQTAGDGFYKVNIPGKKFYQFTDWNGMDVVQYADMVNGAYYMVTRVKTNSLALGHSTETVYKKVDSLLYENVPGRILKKTPIMKNGYKGYDIVNRTRRGDCQRYNIFITPFELVIFKMSGNGEFINSGTEATKFFQSVQLKEYSAGGWHTWQPATGGFSIQVPHTPALLRDNNIGTDRLEYSAWDKQDGNYYLVMKVDLHNYAFIEEDSFELKLMDESYGYSSFIEKQLSRKFTLQNGYPALESKFSHNDGSYSSVKYIIRGPVYYAVIARYKNENANVRRFMESFAVQPFSYPEAKLRTDTSLHFTVRSPLFPEEKKEEITDMDDIYRMAYEELGEEELFRGNDKKFMLIGNDTTGEKIRVVYDPLSKYAYWKDSAAFWKENFTEVWDDDSTFIVRFDKQYSLPNGFRCREKHYTDTGSSRLLMVKTLYKDGHLFNLATLTDTMNQRSPFLQSFFTSFTPADTLKGNAVFVRKTDQVLRDLFSKDSVTARRAAGAISLVTYDSTDVPRIKQTIEALNWDVTEYLRVKRYLIGRLGRSKDTAVTGWLQGLYWKVKDTADLQHAILNALARQQTKVSFTAFKNAMLQEPPIVEESSSSYRYGGRSVSMSFSGFSGRGYFRGREADRGSWYYLYDTLALTKIIFPDILQLMVVDDYEEQIMQLLTKMVDSGYLKAADYESYFSKIYLDGKQLLKKQVAAEDKEKIDRAGKKNQRRSMLLLGFDDDDEEQEVDEGNDDLEQYAALLLPFRDKNPGVQSFFEQLMKTGDRRLLYNTFIMLLHNKQPVPDSLFMKYAKLDKYRSKLYEDLEELKMIDKFPAQYKNQLDITRSLLLNQSDRYIKLDTIVFLDKLPVTYKKKKGWVYFYKYKRMRDDANWYVATVGMQPEKMEEIDIDNDDFTDREEQKLETDKPVKEQLEKMMQEMLTAKRRSAWSYYQARNIRMYKGYMSDMVKSRRYRD